MKKSLLILFTGCLFYLSSFAQTQKVKNQPYGDHRLYHFGLSVGLSFQDLIFTNSGHVNEDGSVWFAEIPNYSVGFSVGLITDLYLNEYMNLRVSPTMHFGDFRVLFKEQSTKEEYSYSARSNYMMIPVDLKFSSMRLNNYRPYVIAGGYGSLNLARKKEEALLLKNMDFGISFGLGCDFYLPIVKVCPELRFYFGLKDMIDKNRSDLRDGDLKKYTDAVSKGTTRMIVLTLNFE